MFAGLARIVRHLLNRHNLACAVTLSAFVVSSLGVRLPFLGEPTAGCCCGEELKAAGPCACKKAKRRRSPVSCCEGSAERSPKPCSKNKAGCCSKERPQPESRCRRSEKSCSRPKSQATCASASESQARFISACHCGGPSETGLLMNAEPRLLTAFVVLPADNEGTRWSPPSEIVPANRFLVPETPPPKVPPFPKLSA